VKFDVSVFFQNLLWKFTSYLNLTRIMGTLHGDLCTVLIKSCWILRTMFQTQGVQKVRTCILYLTTFFQNYAVFEILWKNMLSQMCYRWQCNTALVVCMLDNRLQTLTLEYVILGAIPQQQCVTNMPQCYVIHTLLCFKVVHSKHFLDQCTQFISPTKCTVLIIYEC
jgi:hypothetical protein